MFLKATRKPFLDFLRNLGPQVLALAFAVICVQDIDLHRLDLSWPGVKRTMPFLISMFVFGASLLANASLFLDECLEATREKTQEDVPGSKDSKGAASFIEQIVQGWKANKRAVLCMFCIFIMLEACLILSIGQAVNIAASSPLLQS